MHRSSAFCAFASGFVGLAVLAGCSSQPDSGSASVGGGSAGQSAGGASTVGNAGAPASAGNPNAGGASVSSAGSGGAGGAPSSAGSGGSAGAVGGGTGTAGSAGSGGVSAGGNAGAGGRGGAGGSAGAGGNAGAGGGGGTAGSAPYNPCPTNGDPCRVMPLGDSITEGYLSTSNAGYRLELFRSSLKNNKKLTFVGSHESGPDTVDNVMFPKKQEGHIAWTIDNGGGRSGLYPNIQTWLTAMPPDIITLMIGTNDIDLSLDLPNAPARLGLLLDRVIMYAPKALIVVAQIVPTKDDTENARFMTYNTGVVAQVKMRADAGKHITMVDMYGAFTKNPNYKTAYMADTLHPNDTGYAAMASVWWDAIGALLPAK